MNKRCLKFCKKPLLQDRKNISQNNVIFIIYFEQDIQKNLSKAEYWFCKCEIKKWTILFTLIILSVMLMLMF